MFGGIDGGDAPEVEGVTEHEAPRAAAAAPEARAADESVHDAAEAPEPIGFEVAALASKGAHGRPHVGERGIDCRLAAIGEFGPARPARVAPHDAGVGPGGLDAVGARLGESGVNGLADSEARMGHETEGDVVAADDAVAKALGEGASDGRVEGRDEVNPERGEPRRKDGNRDDKAFPEVEGVGHLAHDLRVRPDVRATDVEGGANGLWGFEGGDQVVQNVADGDGLALCADPSGRDHDRQAFDEVAQDLEGGGARADDHRGSHHGDWDAGGSESGLDLAARGEVLTQTIARFAKTAEVEDALDARTSGGPCKGLGESAILLAVVGGRRVHRVNEVVRGVAAGHGVGERVLVSDVARNDVELFVVGPWTGSELPGVAGEAADRVTTFEEPWGEASADVAGGAGDEDGGGSVGHRDRRAGTSRCGNMTDDRRR